MGHVQLSMYIVNDIPGQINQDDNWEGRWWARG